MDRFIGNIVGCVYDFAICLKSNMDRFIAFILVATRLKLQRFKIQYG